MRIGQAGYGDSVSERMPDVGGWFRTAVDGGVTLPSTGAWGPGTGGFGRTSPEEDVVAAARRIAGSTVTFLTGAGMSTASGLPDYRGPDARPRSPMTFQEFVGSETSRRRYWARSVVGWQAFQAAEPNDNHLRLASLQRRLSVRAVVTQNVDQLHQEAGSDPVIDLHGALSRVVCLGCGLLIDRDDFQDDLLARNPEVARRLDDLAREAMTLPDGDAEVDRTDEFRVPACPRCTGILKPDVVFFGENADRRVVDEAFAALDAADALVVLGSSLTVMSGLRFVRRAARDGKEVVIVNDGATRGDDLANIRLHGRLEDILQTWVVELS